MAHCALSQAPASPPPSYRFASGAAAKNIPIDIVANGLVFVEARVNGHPGWFFVDNGSQGFTVDREFARRNSLTSSGSGLARGGGAATIDVDIIRDVEISLPGLDLTHRVLAAIDLKPIESSVGHKIDGIVGSRLFDDFIVELDFENYALAV
jgi:hypothetical protein